MFPQMTRFVPAILTFGTLLQAQLPQSDAPQTGIATLISAMNDALRKSDTDALAAVFEATSDFRITGSRAVTGARPISVRLLARRPWSEVTPPKIENMAIRMITPNVAVVDAAWVQYGSAVTRRALPVLLVVKKEGEHWRVASLRLGLWHSTGGAEPVPR
jgi:hypothetical protein